MDWGSYIYSLVNKPIDEQTKDDREMILFADIKSKFKNINNPKDITDELWSYYRDVKFDKVQESREIFYTSKEDRLKDTNNPCNSSKKHLEVKGNVIDKLCDLLNIPKEGYFQDHIKHNRIYEEDIKGSDWYQLVLAHNWELNELYTIEVGEDFKENPLRYFKSYCLKVMGISCTLNQPKGYHPDDMEGLWKEYKKKDIFRMHYSDVFPKPRYLPTKMHKCCNDFIDRKIAKGENLTANETLLRTYRKHVEIHRQQPSCSKLLFICRENLNLKLLKEEDIPQNKQYFTPLAFDHKGGRNEK